MCNFELSIPSLELAYPISFASYFAAEIPQLKSLQDDGLLTIDDKWIVVTLKGRLLIRNICMVFDRYLALPRVGEAVPIRFSQTI
jgi:oxygen-independent coproporphyrinogen-3 oxidase